MQQALKLDPTFAPAWVWLSVAREVQAGWTIPRQQGFEEARHADSQALALDPNLSEAHSVMAVIHLRYDWDWTGTQAEARKAIELDPGNAYPWLWDGRLAQMMGHYDKALESFQKAATMDPLNAFVYWYIGNSNYMMGRFAEAQAAFRKAADLDPGRGVWGGSIGPVLVKLASGKPTAALADLDSAKDESDRLFGQALAYHALGRKVEADLALGKYEKSLVEPDAYGIAEIYAFRGEIDRAFVLAAASGGCVSAIATSASTSGGKPERVETAKMVSLTALRRQVRCRLQKDQCAEFRRSRVCPPLPLRPDWVLPMSEHQHCPGIKRSPSRSPVTGTTPLRRSQMPGEFALGLLCHPGRSEAPRSVRR